MHFRYITLFFSAIILTLFLSPSSADARSFSIDSVDIHAFILPDGDLYVEELYTYTFNGSYNGTTRIIGDDDFNGFEFFEAYKVPDDAVMGNIPKDIDPLKVEKDNYTFKIYQSSKDETKKVFYRYRLKDAIRKYEDIGEFYWRFFDEMGEDDLNDLEIFVSLYGKSQLPDNSYGFMHDLTGGTFELRGGGLYYHNKKLPGGEPFELRLLFPNDFLNEMDYTKKEEMLPTFLQEEADYDKKLKRRTQWLPKLESTNSVILIFLLIFCLYSIFYPRRIARLMTRPLRFSQVEQMDSFTLTALLRHLKFQPQDINAALFRLYQNGIVSVERVETNDTDNQNSPDYTFKFVLEKSTTELAEHEKFLINWLFTKSENGKKYFSLDQIPVRSMRDHKENWRKLGELKKAEQTFKMQYKDWKKLAAADKELHELVKPVFFRKVLHYVLTPLWIVWIAVSGILLSMSSMFAIIIGTISLILIYLFILYKKRGRIYFTIFYFISLIVMNMMGMDYGTENLQVLPFAFMLISVFLPEAYTTYRGASLYKGMKKWRKAVKKNELEISSNSLNTERCYQHAIALGRVEYFHAFYGESITASATEAIYPFLISPLDTATIYSYNYRTIRSTYYRGNSSGSSTGSSGGSGGGGGAGAF